MGVRSKFLSKEQQGKVQDVVKSEWASDLELSGMSKSLAKNEGRAKRIDYNKKLQHANARKMRLIYYRLLTDRQKEDFDQSVKRRMKASQK